jgi:hypothetical protein
VDLEFWFPVIVVVMLLVLLLRLDRLGREVKRLHGELANLRSGVDTIGEAVVPRQPPVRDELE